MQNNTGRDDGKDRGLNSLRNLWPVSAAPNDRSLL